MDTNIFNATFALLDLFKWVEENDPDMLDDEVREMVEYREIMYCLEDVLEDEI